MPEGAPPPGGVLAGAPCAALAAGVLERVATTETPQPLLAVVRYRSAGAEVLAGAGFVVVAVGLSDPGNLGTILRTAEAAGADAVVLTPDTVDATNPKVVRASAGALFLLPVVDHVELGELRAAGLRVLGTSAASGTAYTDADLTGRLALAVGNEARGLAADASGRRLADHPPRRAGREPQRGDGRRGRLLRGRPPATGAGRRPRLSASSGSSSAPAGTTTR